MTNLLSTFLLIANYATHGNTEQHGIGQVRMHSQYDCSINNAALGNNQTFRLAPNVQKDRHNGQSLLALDCCKGG